MLEGPVNPLLRLDCTLLREQAWSGQASCSFLVCGHVSQDMIIRKTQFSYILCFITTSKSKLHNTMKQVPGLRVKTVNFSAIVCPICKPLKIQALKKICLAPPMPCLT